MSRVTKPLTDKEIKSAKPKTKTIKLFDGGGLFLSITPKGKKLWRLKYRLAGKEKLISLGGYPAISLLDARKQRALLKEKITLGIDPSLERKQKKEINKEKEIEAKYTFELLTNEYFKHIAGLENPLNEKYRKKQKNRVVKHCYPTLKFKPINEITEEDTLFILETLKKDGFFEVARRVLLLVKAILRYGVRRKLLKYNTASDISAKDELGKRSKNHYPIITDPKELKKLLIAIDEYKGAYSVKQALKIMPYVAFRPGNIRFLEWDEVNLEKKLITISAFKMKMNKELVSPISKTVLKILEETRFFSGDSKYVFPSPIHKNRPLSENTLNLALRRMEYTKEQLVSHSFRRIFSTIMHDNMRKHGFSSLAIEAQLAHKDTNESRDAYNDSNLLEERKEMMEWWADWLDSVKLMEEQ